MLRDRFGHDYTALVSDTAGLRVRIGAGEWQVILAKGERGGRYKLAKMMTEHGAKGDLAADFGAHRDTLSREEKLYDNLPWAYPLIVEEANKASPEGKDYVYSIDHIIDVGRKAAAAAGATKTRPKYHGSGNVLMIDPVTRTIGPQKFPAGFPGSKSATPHWEQVAEYEFQAAVQLWKEIDGNTRGYYLFDLPLKDTSKHVVLPCHQRVLLLRINKKTREVLSIPLPSDALMSRIDFDAREPLKVDVFSVDPSAGKVERVTVMNNEIVVSFADKVLTALGGRFTGLTLVQIDTGSIFAFAIGEQRFKGRSLIVRLESEGQWIAPLASPVSAVELAGHITFNALEAAARESGEELPVDPNAGFEQLDNTQQYEQVWQDYFGLSYKQINDLLARETGSYGYDAYAKAGYYRRDGAKSLWNIAKLRVLVEKTKTDLAAAKAEGFAELDATTISAIFGSDDGAERLRLVRQALGLNAGQEVNKRLEDGGYLTRIAGKNLWKLDMLRELIERGKEKANEPEPVEPVAPNAGDATEPEAEEEVEAAGTEEDDTDEANTDETGTVAPEEEQSVVEVKPELDTMKGKVIDIPYEEMGYEDRGLADRELISEIKGKLGTIDWIAMRCLTQLMPGGHIQGADALTTRTWLEEALDTVDKMLSLARQANPPLTTLSDHLDILKSEAAPVSDAAVVKRSIIRLAPHLAAPTIVACYVKTKDGKMVPVFGDLDQHATA